MRLFLFGTGGHARVVADIIQLVGEHEIAGVVNETGRPPEEFMNTEIVATNRTYKEKIREYGVEGAVVALGNSNARRTLSRDIATVLQLPAIIHPAAVISDSTVIAQGVTIMAGAVVNIGTQLDEGVIVNTSASIDHDCSIGSFAHVCPGVTIAGHVTVGENSWIGVGSVISDHLSIGSDVFVSAGSVVTKDIPSGHRVVGRKISRSESYPPGSS